MMTTYWVCGSVTGGLILYLLWVLFKPEDF